MIHCLSCKKYPKDGKVILFSATFPTVTESDAGKYFVVNAEGKWVVASL